MNKKLIVKASLFTIILAFMVGGMFAKAAVMNKEKPVDVTEKAAVMETWELIDQTADPTISENYQPFQGNPLQLCQGVNELCAVIAEDDGNGLPILTPDLISQILRETEATDVYFKN